MAKEPMKDIIVVLPGILGSALAKDGKEAWGMSGGAIARTLFSIGRNVKNLALEGDDHTVDDLGDGVSATRLLPDMHLVPGFWKIDGYGTITKSIRDTFDVVEGENFFEFPYDWRRDNRVAARRLRRESHEWLKHWKVKSGNDDAKLILLAHSMGGLVSRAFLELEEGWRDTKTLVTFGTPYRGSLNAVGFVANGFPIGLGPIKIMDLGAMLRTLTSVYQLMPIYPCLDPGDGNLVRPGEADTIPNMDTAMAADALAFHHSIRDAVAANGASADYVERGYGIHPVAGMDQPTLQSARIDGDRVRMFRSHGGDDFKGDGTVPRVASYPLEWDDAADGMFSAEKHASLQNTPAVLDHVRGILTADAIDLGGFRDRKARLGLDIDDLVPADAGTPVSVTCSDDRQDVTVRAVDEATGNVVRTLDMTAGSLSGELDGLPEGVYRVTAESDDGARVTDIVTAIDVSEE